MFLMGLAIFGGLLFRMCAVRLSLQRNAVIRMLFPLITTVGQNPTAAIDPS
jgi:hypothetical protein